MSMIFDDIMMAELAEDYGACEHKEINTPKYVNCKHGFLKILFYPDGEPYFAGFTPNMRVATPLYGTNSHAYSIAKRVMKDHPTTYGYFAVVELTQIGFDKEKEICV